MQASVIVVTLSVCVSLFDFGEGAVFKVDLHQVMLTRPLLKFVSLHIGFN